MRRCTPARVSGTLPKALSAHGVAAAANAELPTVVRQGYVRNLVALVGLLR